MTRCAFPSMRRAGLAGALLLALAGPVLVHGAAAGDTTGSSTMKTSATDASGESRPADGLLAEGAGAEVAPDAPARLVLPRDRVRAAVGPLSLALVPTRIAEDEAFLVSVVAIGPDGAEREIGSYAFFPPPREGTPRRFPLDLSTLAEADGPLTLEVRLLPVEAGLEETRLRVEGVVAGE
ncbi:hypothetical protein [Salinarimonas rosea]|uniref:hypothetical protein n=1 Tax=Salinarimonas rosea TaxID=552063 RepID=UPI00041D5524|nr:hypothetical protein [Salinarimonas rosea]